MKDDGLNKFFAEHKQVIENDGFKERLFSHLDCLPAPKPRADRSELIISIFAAIGFVLFVVLGGYKVLITGLSSMGSLFGNIKLITPEVIFPVIFMACSIIALARYAIKEQ